MIADLVQFIDAVEYTYFIGWYTLALAVLALVIYSLASFQITAFTVVVLGVMHLDIAHKAFELKIFNNLEVIQQDIAYLFLLDPRTLKLFMIEVTPWDYVHAWYWLFAVTDIMMIVACLIVIRVFKLKRDRASNFVLIAYGLLALLQIARWHDRLGYPELMGGHNVLVNVYADGVPIINILVALVLMLMACRLLWFKVFQVARSLFFAVRFTISNPLQALRNIVMFFATALERIWLLLLRGWGYSLAKVRGK